MSAFEDLEMELADIADEHLWVSKFISLTADLEDVGRHKAVLALEHKWSNIENLPKPDKLVYETWNAIPDTKGMHLESCPSLDPHPKRKGFLNYELH
ncbi:hypothetical protein F2P81_025287 [Scophthalmus maximus]|uniref:Uncharacterized protein n=1 Tax=Scophthalmus maximus TaxID=52904 RepID=A0A6A4RVD7_SCOMX|nr:hypothetical protein F2P81_025287 [Scophthalmus maximus]